MVGADISSRFESLIAAHSYAEIADLLLALEMEQGYVDREDLRDDPFWALEGHPGLEVLHEVQTEPTCSVAGYFRESSRPPALIVHPSGAYRRDAFTVLHEYGHYVQMAHAEWADVLLMLPDQRQAFRAGERVADEFASEVLLPAATLGIDPADVTARQLCEAFDQNRHASRSALAYRVVSRAQPRERLMIAVVADWGREVLFARSIGDLMAPGRGVEQPSLRALAIRARESLSGVAYGDPTGKILAKSGWGQSDIRLEVATDPDGYAFVVGRPSRRFGTTAWSRSVLECSNPACEETFQISDALVKCRKCEEWRCPECGECSCPHSASDICPSCFMQRSPAEIAGAILHEC